MLTGALFDGERVRLSAITSDDISTIVGWSRDTEYLRGLDSGAARPATEEKTREWIDAGQKSQHGFLFGVRLKTDNRLIGFVEIDGISWNHGVAWLAIAIGEAADRNSGYGREAFSLAIDYAFRELNLHRVQLTAFGYNQRAIALYEKLGFVREGTHRENLHRDGKRYDMYLYGMLRREWEARTRSKA